MDDDSVLRDKRAYIKSWGNLQGKKDKVSKHAGREKEKGKGKREKGKGHKTFEELTSSSPDTTLTYSYYYHPKAIVSKRYGT